MKAMLMVCENPYPCAFDRGIIQAMAARFEPAAQVKHVDLGGCRKKAAESCSYLVSW